MTFSTAHFPHFPKKEKPMIHYGEKDTPRKPADNADASLIRRTL
jgi:hypothetical protein